MESPRALLAGSPLLLRWIVVSAAIGGIAGAPVGLVVGLRTYAATAWFAVVEVGLPATILGALIGLVIGSVILVARRIPR